MRLVAWWKPKARLVTERLLLLMPSARPLLKPVRMYSRIPSVYLRIVFATRTNGASCEREAQSVHSLNFTRATFTWRRSRIAARLSLSS